MFKSFYRKGVFGFRYDEDILYDPLKFSQAQFSTIPELTWKDSILSKRNI
tara:strand:+ start:200 stop:349 length:150 start_codon:yes stop_codon:yes gene_type:complete